LVAGSEAQLVAAFLVPQAAAFEVLLAAESLALQAAEFVVLLAAESLALQVAESLSLQVAESPSLQVAESRVLQAAEFVVLRVAVSEAQLVAVFGGRQVEESQKTAVVSAQVLLSQWSAPPLAPWADPLAKEQMSVLAHLHLSAEMGIECHNLSREPASHLPHWEAVSAAVLAARFEVFSPFPLHKSPQRQTLSELQTETACSPYVAMADAFASSCVTPRFRHVMAIPAKSTFLMSFTLWAYLFPAS
jgi:hypothetical protein